MTRKHLHYFSPKNLHSSQLKATHKTFPNAVGVQCTMAQKRVSTLASHWSCLVSMVMVLLFATRRGIWNCRCCDNFYIFERWATVQLQERRHVQPNSATTINRQSENEMRARKVQEKAKIPTAVGWGKSIKLRIFQGKLCCRIAPVPTTCFFFFPYIFSVGSGHWPSHPTQRSTRRTRNAEGGRRIGNVCLRVARMDEFWRGGKIEKSH